MAIEKISQRLNSAGFSGEEARALQALFEAVAADFTATTTAVAGLAAKLDADAGVTDTNYAALWTPVTGNITK